MQAALDESDKWQAAGAWAGIFVGGPIVPIVILALNWSKTGSLARRHAKVATIIWVVVLAVYVPMVLRIFTSPGAPDAAFFVVLAIVVVVTWGSAIVGVVQALRAPVAPPAWPAMPPGYGPPPGYGSPSGCDPPPGYGPPPGFGPPPG
jgi:hypothetical protein